MNRIWAHHIGDGIVATPNDFGTMGQSPTHPELLDWLAAEFVERGYSLKAMHRLIVTSATYCQTSLYDPGDTEQAKAHAADPGDHFLWRGRGMRLEGEAIRDAILQVAGDLNLKMGGPSAKPKLPENDRPLWLGPRSDRARSESPLGLCAGEAQFAISAARCVRSARHAQQLPAAATRRFRPRRRWSCSTANSRRPRLDAGPAG